MDEIHIIIRMPSETVRLEATAFVMDEDGKLHEAVMTLSPSDIREARQDFLNNVELGDDFDTVLTLTDKGKTLLRHMDTDEVGDWDSIGINDVGGE